MYWLNYLDRNAIALARLNELEEDLNLTSTRKSTHILGPCILERKLTCAHCQNTKHALVSFSWDTY